LSGPEFSRVHGINYQTFATWSQKRNRARKSNIAGTTATAAQSITLVEAVAAERPSATVSVDLPGGCRVQIDSHQQLRLVAGLLAELATATGGESC
jgi:cobalamin biosynthesis protein CbiD